MIRGSLIVLALASLVVAAAGRSAGAQPKGDGPMIGIGRPPFLDELYRPEMLMRSQGELGLTGEQRTAITDAIKAAQDRLSTLQWDLAAKNEAVGKLVAPDHVDAEAALAAASQTIDLEGQIKKEHLKLLLQIRDGLLDDQVVLPPLAVAPHDETDRARRFPVDEHLPRRHDRTVRHRGVGDGNARDVEIRRQHRGPARRQDDPRIRIRACRGLRRLRRRRLAGRRLSFARTESLNIREEALSGRAMSTKPVSGVCCVASGC